MEERNSSGEMNITQVMSKIREGYHGFLIWLYRIFQFFVSRWLIVIGIIVFGLILGFLLQKDEFPKETTLLVQINFETANYIYDAIEQLENRIDLKDTERLKEIGLYQDKATITEIEIEPVVDILEIVKSEKGDERNLEILMQQSRYEEDLLTSELFIPKYKLHKIKLKTSSEADEEIIQSLMDYLNGNTLLDKIKITALESAKKEIRHNEESISYIDSIVKAYGTKPLVGANNSQIYFNKSEINNVHLLFEQKNIIIEQNDKIKIEVLKYDNVVELINKPMLQTKKGFFDNKIIAYPALLLLIFILFSILAYFYNKAKRLSMSTE